MTYETGRSEVRMEGTEGLDVILDKGPGALPPLPPLAGSMRLSPRAPLRRLLGL